MLWAGRVFEPAPGFASLNGDPMILQQLIDEKAATGMAVQGSGDAIKS